MDAGLILPDWPAHPRVKSCSTTRLGGCSSGLYQSFNLGAHVKDNPESVRLNRQDLCHQIDQLSVCWLNQNHTDRVVAVGNVGTDPADASYTSESNQVCAVLTADCLPVLLTDRKGTWVAAVHAGWRGLLKNIISKAVKRAPCPPNEILAWLGPAISQEYYTLPKDHVDQFLHVNPGYKECFDLQDDHRYAVDLYQLARVELRLIGVDDVFGGNYCTYGDEHRFYSYRRDGQVTGRMASLIWLNK
ncbi:MAG TPA: peptidoglycan editing factor PgeF [Gammaproteobacteria bacterium]|nr:peptidoglycan editing factor PgeF [Gammaproteobacteria bacterium]